MTNQKSVEEAFIVLTTEIDGAIAESLAKELLSRKLAEIGRASCRERV